MNLKTMTKKRTQYVHAMTPFMCYSDKCKMVVTRKEMNGCLAFRAGRGIKCKETRANILG